VTAPLLWLGLLFGFRHALEPDHVAAVASLASGSNGARATVRIAAAWGLGHAAMVLLVGAGLSALGVRAPPALSSLLEGAAGALLVLLGLDVLRRWRALRARATDAPAAADARRGLRRAFLVGGVHGMAGSGALTVAVVPLLPSRASAWAYLAVFGLGSIAGMLACSLALSLPLRARTSPLARAARGSQLVVGAVSVVVGCWVAARAAW
jgi:threonine/homoserine/homoserine lactone efflux protein